MNFQAPSPGGVFPQPDRRQGLFTAMGAILLCAGFLFLLLALYQQSAWGALLLAPACMFIGAVICWICSARSAVC
jgi:hypothetical protein